MCLRDVAHLDPVWVTSAKTIPTFVISLSLLIHKAWKGGTVFPSYRVLRWLVLAGLLGQFGGNLTFQKSLSIVGLALVVPLTMGTVIAGGAVLGRAWLNEPITRRLLLAMTALIVAIVVLSAGASQANATVAEDLAGHIGFGWAFFGVVLACGSGGAYAVLGVVIRKASAAGASLGATLFVVSTCGMTALFPLAWYRIGFDGMLATDASDLGSMAGAGVFNAVAFFALTKSLQLIPVVHVNLINASQIAMAAVAGVVWFSEPASPQLALGVVLTIAGLLVMDRRIGRRQKK